MRLTLYTFPPLGRYLYLVYLGTYLKENIKNRCKGRPGQAQTHIYTSACASGDASPGGGEGERGEEKEGSMRSSRSQGVWGDGEAGGPWCRRKN